MFGEIKKRNIGKLKEGGSRLPQHSIQVHGDNYSLHRCLVFGEIKKVAKWTLKVCVQRLPERKEQVFKEVSTVHILVQCVGK